MSDLKGKKILFIAAQLFGIQEAIIDSLEKRGAEVIYFDERPANSFLVKAAIRINRNLIGYYINRYHKDIIARTSQNKFDYIFFIKGESFSYNNLAALLSAHPEAKSIVYQWDSIANNNNALNLLGLFDSKFSFDRQDCKNLSLSFLPLFYYDEYASIKESGGRYDYDLFFVGTAHSDRYRIIKAVRKQFENLGKRCYTYFFFQGKLMFYKYYLQHKEARSMRKDEVNYESVSRNDLLELYKKSKIVIDVCHPKQTGLTLRCIEALGAGRKLITTNRDIENYDFYNPNNIHIIESETPQVSSEFIESDYDPVPEEIYAKYSLSGWLDVIFGDNN